MVKLIIQIPCYNEEETIVETLSALPREIPGVNVVEWLIVDDGCTDSTVKKALDHGVDHVVHMQGNRGLARAFTAGLEACLRRGADIIVNTDADNQYRGCDIPKLIGPILSGEAEIVVGARPIESIESFSPLKKLLQKAGSKVVSMASSTNIPDAPSGFRAISRDAAMRLNVFNNYTYTLETIIQAGQKGMAITSVPIETNVVKRPSRLIKNIPEYIRRSAFTILRIFMTYKPFKFFAVLGLISFLAGFSISIRYLFFYFAGQGAGHIQSVILSSLLMGTGFFLFIIGLVADLISVNRLLLEKLDWRVQKLEEKIDGPGKM